MESSYTATGRGKINFKPSSVEQKHQHPAVAPKIQRKRKSKSRARDGKRKVRLLVLSQEEAEVRTEAAATFLRAKEFTFNKPENLRRALTPGVNLRLAQLGDKAQGLVLADQWAEDGRYNNNFFEHRVFQPVGTNEYQALMATKHGIDKHIFPTAEDSESSSSQHGGRQDHSPKMKIRADTMEALMGAICKDGNGDWWETLERFMRVFELDFDAALRHRRS